MMMQAGTEQSGHPVREIRRPERRLRRLVAATALMLLGFGAQASAETIDVGHIIKAEGNPTTVVVERQSDGQVWISNPTRAEQRFSPASTSKIPHTLIALENGIATTDTVFAWDGFPKGVAAWNQDQTLASAFERSAVWVYQQIARTAGQHTMSQGLAQFDYGNQAIGAADHLTRYWLDGTLQISAVEQVTFLKRLAQQDFALSASTYAAALDIMVSDRGDAWVMRSKTGWRYSDTEMDIGWFVGWLDCADETYVFAVNMDIPNRSHLSKRKDVAYAVLRDIGAFDCS